VTERTLAGAPALAPRAFVPGLLAGLALACSPAQPPRPAPAPDHAAPIGPAPLAVSSSHVVEVRNGDAFSTALARAGVSGPEVEELVGALEGRLDVRACRPGQWFEVRRDPAGRLSWFRYFGGPTSVVLAHRDAAGALVAFAEPIPVEFRQVVVEGTVESSLYEAMSARGEAPALTLAMVDLFSWDVDFLTEPQPGDRFRVVVEKRHVDGKFVGYGDIIGAEYAFATGTRRHRAFRYRSEAGVVGYYTENGTAVEKAFLKSPIKFASITSRYGMRRHPVLKYARAHRGVDYGAPRGTAVWSVGEGVVAFAGRAGGYGNVVYVRHRNGLETRYAHLQGFGPGVRTGARLGQKAVVGFVGSTGLSTGPHLHFEVLRNGHHTNPLTMAAPPAPPIPEAELPRFFEAVTSVVAAIERPSAATAMASPARERSAPGVADDTATATP
jgi:murein DD-endopeptidase MepM/ murein hydrolase activator NlpD